MLAASPDPDRADPARRLAVASTRMMWACAFATAHATIASAARGLELWSHMLRPPPAPPMRQPAPGEEAASPVPAGESEDAKSAVCASEQAPAAAPHKSPQGAAAGFATYRSPSGHATAQIIVAE